MCQLVMQSCILSGLPTNLLQKLNASTVMVLLKLKQCNFELYHLLNSFLEMYVIIRPKEAITVLVIYLRCCESKLSNNEYHD